MRIYLHRMYKEKNQNLKLDVYKLQIHQPDDDKISL